MFPFADSAHDFKLSSYSVTNPDMGTDGKRVAFDDKELADYPRFSALALFPVKKKKLARRTPEQ